MQLAYQVMRHHIRRPFCIWLQVPSTCTDTKCIVDIHIKTHLHQDSNLVRDHQHHLAEPFYLLNSRLAYTVTNCTNGIKCE